MAVLTTERRNHILTELEPMLPHEECRSCECYLGFLTQLALDSEREELELVSGLGIEKEALHSCLGCQPCPPADAFAAYLKYGCSCC